MNPSIVITRLQYQRRPESGEAGFNEDTTSFPLRAAVRILMAIQPKLSGPIQVARNLFTRALINLRQKPLSCFRVRFHQSVPFFASASHEQMNSEQDLSCVTKDLTGATKCM